MCTKASLLIFVFYISLARLVHCSEMDNEVATKAIVFLQKIVKSDLAEKWDEKHTIGVVFFI